MCYPSADFNQNYTDYFTNQNNKSKIQKEILTKGVISDCNTYDSKNDFFTDENVKLIVCDYRKIRDFKERIKTLKFYK